MNFDENRVTSVDLITNDPPINKETIKVLFISFIENFKSPEKNYAYILSNNINQRLYELRVDLEHISQYDTHLSQNMHQSPEKCIGWFEEAIMESYNLNALTGFHLQFVSSANIVGIRDICAAMTNKIIRIQGIVVSASSIVVKPKTLFLVCKSCLQSKEVNEVIPRSCDNTQCPVDPYMIIPEKSHVMDVQYVKIQEVFDDIPVGETPRHFSLVLEKNMINIVVPGSKVIVTGIYAIKSSKGKSWPFLQVIGLEDSRSKVRTAFTEDEEERFNNLAQSNAYEIISRSIAPSIYGHEDIKKTLACMLFGGTRRTLDDKITLRGDINVLLLGDPGVAKSQLLKFMEIASPVSVYTSGKGSSAAGLTACVIKDSSGEFYLEGGALVLADNGICCIDEFDKMNETDRVAIHEAMEQQTISIAKAGITTVLNTRTSILAAANPVFGRYDDYKTPDENIEFGSTILSRFDCIYILKDNYGPKDLLMAEHVIGLHKGVQEDKTKSKCESEGLVSESGALNEFSTPNCILSVEDLRRYVQYVKARCKPTLTKDASQLLINFYVNTRSEVREMDSKKTTIPITVRQLEAIIRLSEALAKMEMSSISTQKHAQEAIRLFKISTMNAVAQGHYLEGMIRPDVINDIEKVCSRIKELMPVGCAKKYSVLVKMLDKFSEWQVKKAVDFMCKQNKLISKDMGRMLIRLP